MNEVKINKNEIESIWEKDNLCFIKMKSGKVWICNKNYHEMQTIDYIKESKGLISLPLSIKGGK